MALHPRGFTDDFGSDTYGVELDHRPQIVQIRAAESCFTEDINDEIIAMLKQPPCRVIKVWEASFTAEQIGRR